MIYPNRAFFALLCLAIGCAVMLTLSAARLLSAGIPADGWASINVAWRCLLIPGRGDVPLHIANYLLLTVLGCGTVRGSGLLLLQWYRTRCFLANWNAPGDIRSEVLARSGARVGLTGRLDLLRSPYPLAFCYGLSRPRVCVTTGLLAVLSERELEAILRHEEYHVIHCDPLKLILANALAATFFFLPLLGMLRSYYTLAKELAADRHVVRAMGADRSLAAALCKLLAAAPAADSSIAVGTTTCLTARVDVLLGEHHSPRLHFPVAGLLRTAMAIALLALPLFAPLPIFTGNTPLVLGQIAHSIC